MDDIYLNKILILRLGGGGRAYLLFTDQKKIGIIIVNIRALCMVFCIER